MFSNYIFDFDGTIADNFFVVVKVVTELNLRYKLIPPETLDFDKLRGSSTKDLLTQLKLPKLKYFYILFLLLTKLGKGTQKASVVKDMYETLDELKGRGCLLGIVTSSRKKFVEAFLKSHGISCFDFIDSSIHLFGKDKVLNKLIKKYELDPKETVYIGDEVRDIEAAKAAGMTTCAVTWGYNNEKILREAAPDFVVHTAKEISII